MKKDNDPTTFLNKPMKYLFYSFLFFCGVIFCLRVIDSIGFYMSFPYGHYHFPTNREISFFRQGERETGEIGEFGFRKGNLKNNASCGYLLLGDSQTFGSGIFWKDSFPEILNRETGCNWINVSIPGFTLENEYSTYEKVSSRFEFRSVYLFIYGNDIYETGDTPDFLHFVNHKKYFHIFSFLFPEHSRLYLKKSYFESIQKRMEAELKRVAKQTYQIPDLKEKKNEVVDFLPLKTLFRISPNYLSSSLNTKTFAKINFDRWKKILFLLNDKIVKQGKQLNLVYIPLEVEFDRTRYQVYQGIGYDMNPEWLESDSEFIKDLIQLSKENHIPLIDLRNQMRYRSDLLQTGDIHLNEKAHRLIADVLKKNL